MATATLWVMWDWGLSWDFSLVCFPASRGTWGFHGLPWRGGEGSVPRRGSLRARGSRLTWLAAASLGDAHLPLLAQGLGL